VFRGLSDSDQFLVDDPGKFFKSSPSPDGNLVYEISLRYLKEQAINNCGMANMHTIVPGSSQATVKDLALSNCFGPSYLYALMKKYGFDDSTQIISFQESWPLGAALIEGYRLSKCESGPPHCSRIPKETVTNYNFLADSVEVIDRTKIHFEGTTWYGGGLSWLLFGIFSCRWIYLRVMYSNCRGVRFGVFEFLVIPAVAILLYFFCRSFRSDNSYVRSLEWLLFPKQKHYCNCTSTGLDGAIVAAESGMNIWKSRTGAREHCRMNILGKVGMVYRHINNTWPCDSQMHQQLVDYCKDNLLKTYHSLCEKYDRLI